MNTFQAINTEYLRPDRTIETIMVKNENAEQIFFVYNDQGKSFRIFENVLDLINYLEGEFEPKLSFDQEEELDEYLETVELILS